MSFKGFTKAIGRAPQTFRHKFKMGEETQDPVYEDAERRFKELETDTKKLSDASKRYSNAVNGMLTHQIGFAKAMEEIFKPISGKMSDPNATIPEDNPEGIEASEQYRAIVAELQETLKPDLALINDKVVQPCQELLKIITYIRKMATKRNHKKLDLDKHLNTYTKYQNKKEPNAKDEERMYKAQASMEVAQQEYDYYNEMLKTQLPILFNLEAQFVQPLFVSFYYMQLNIFYSLYNRFQDMKIPYFDLNSDIIEAYIAKKGNVEEQADSLTITNFKIGYSKAKLEMTKKRYGVNNDANSPNNMAPAFGQQPTGYGQQPQMGYAQQPGVMGQQPGVVGQQPGVMGQQPAGTYGQQPGGYPPEKQSAFGAQPQPMGYPQQPNAMGQLNTATTAPPAYSNTVGITSPISPMSPMGTAAPIATATPGVEYCTALYDYQAQAQGDLSFPAGAQIEIVQRVDDVNQWWTGKYNGQQGVFPGNYVQLNQQ